jgi:hypothetical protein
MSINKLKSIVRRGTILGAAFAVVAATFAPASLSFADALNPLTERSLTLSSSSPGWENQDGSGNSTYAPPNSGANGQKTGNYFSFKVSTDTSTGSDKIMAMSFQYCTAPAGACNSPGNDTVHGTDDPANNEADLNVNYPSAAPVDNSDFATVVDGTSGLVKAVPGYTNSNPKYQSAGGNSTGSNGVGDPAEAAKAVAGNFIVMTKSGGTWTPTDDWTAVSSNQEDGSSKTGQQNTIIIQNTGSGLGLTSGTEVKVLFFATGTNYITNPGEGAFFVKINTFKNFDALSAVPGSENTLLDNIASGDVIDGGVTVANVMNQSIQITTKVLETMQFSVGTVDPNTLNDTQLAATDLAIAQHSPCDIIQTRLNTSDTKNVLALGDQDQESSLSTTATYGTHSYWRLSSNSSAGATVYYSGHTLSNTSGDEIRPIGVTKSISTKGAEQFGLAIDSKAVTGSANAFENAAHAVDYSVDRTGTAATNYENAADTNNTVSVTGVDNSLLTDLGATGSPGSYNYSALNQSYHTPKLDPLTPTTNYSSGSGKVNGASGALSAQSNASFAFDPLSDTVPTPIADESSQVVDCVTAKMRYIANIAATTPAGIYTTKINYIAAPQY